MIEQPVSDPTAVFLVLAAVVAVALALEANTRTFRALGAALVGILLAMLLSNLGVIPGESPAYEFLGGPAVSAGIVLILLTVDVRSVVQAGPTMLAAFLVGAVGSAAGASLGALVLAEAIGPETWKLAGQYAATYTGGGVNFAADVLVDCVFRSLIVRCNRMSKQSKGNANKKGPVYQAPILTQKESCQR